MNKFLIFLILIPFLVCAQSSWKRTETIPDRVELFHSSKTANYPTTEHLLKGNFQFEISHRFSYIDEGYDNFFGLDGPANIRIGLAYGITDELMVTLGRSNVLASLDLALKYKISEFASDAFPSALAINGGLTLVGRDENFDIQTFNSDYMQFFGQLVYNFGLLDKNLIVGVIPSFVYNSYSWAAGQGLDTETTASVGTHVQYYFNRMWSIWAEYTAVVSGYNGSVTTYNEDGEDPISFGTAIETGGHIFHLFITNSNLINPSHFLIGTTPPPPGSDNEPWIFGFTITREL